MGASIPRFLLPQRSSIWRSKITSSFTSAHIIRNASRKAMPKPKPNIEDPPTKVPTLMRPTRFNPPSHGSKLREKVQYPGPRLSDYEVKAQQTKQYPNMMPPKGSFMHWFLNNRAIHLYITLGTLFSLAGYAGITHFKRTSKFGDMLPHASDLIFDPIGFLRTCIEVLRLHTAHMTAETAEKRRKKIEDVQKRATYRKKHGMETDAFGGWNAKGDGELLGPAVHDNVVAGAVSKIEAEEQLQPPRKRVKKWLGIW